MHSVIFCKPFIYLPTVFIDAAVLGKFQRDVQHRETVESHPTRAVSLF